MSETQVDQLPQDVVAVAVVEPPARKLTRDEIRAKIFNQVANRQEVLYLGIKLFIKEPPIDTIIHLQSFEDKKVQFTQGLAMMVYTEDDEPVFEVEDAEALVRLPFGKDLQNLQNKINELLGVQPDKGDKSPAEEE